MEENSDTLRQQMEETKTQLTEKLESLELQVSETVQSTGTAVNATVEAVHETVDSVTDAMHEAATFVSQTFDLQRQFQRHPILVIGGAFALGYLAISFLRGNSKRSTRLAAALPTKPNSAPVTVEVSTPTGVDSRATTAAIASAYEAGRENSAWSLLRNQAINLAIGVASDLATQAIPHVINHFNGQRDDAQKGDAQDDGRQGSGRQTDSSTEMGRLHIALPPNSRSRNSF